jgi:hypothetical protein
MDPTTAAGTAVAVSKLALFAVLVCASRRASREVREIEARKAACAAEAAAAAEAAEGAAAGAPVPAPAPARPERVPEPA